MHRAELVEHVVRTLRPMRGEPEAELRGAADAVIRAEEGDSMAGAYALEGRRSRRVALLLEQARHAMRERLALEARAEQTGREVKGVQGLPVVASTLDVQEALIVLGYKGPHGVAIEASGVLSPATMHAVKHFQRNERLPQTGVPDITTKRDLEWVLFIAGWDAEAFPARVAEVPTATTGAADGTSVGELQFILNRLGFRGANGRRLTLDGRIGPNTTHALRAFQASEGLAVDGRLEGETARWLELALTARTHGEFLPATPAEEAEWERYRPTVTGAEGDAYASAVEAARKLDCLRPGNVLAFQEAYSVLATSRGQRPLAPTSVLDHPTQVALMTMSAEGERTGYSDPGHAYGPHRPPFAHAAPDPYCPESVEPFPWHGCAEGAVELSPRQLGDPLYAAMRTPWMGAQGYGAQYIMHDQDRSDFVPSPAYRWHWLEHSSIEGERD